MVQLAIGKPAQGDDFFDREIEQSRLWRGLQTGNLLLLAPRRVGKTSLLLRLRDDAEARGYQAVFASVSDADSEARFLENLCRGLEAVDAGKQIAGKFRDGPLKKLLKWVRKIDVAGTGVELDGGTTNDWRAAAEKLLQALGKSNLQWLFLIDEIPIFVMTLERLDSTHERMRQFLSWFRELRTVHPAGKRLHWVLAGSIGLDTVTQRLGLSDTINDLQIENLEAFDEKTADDFLQKLGEAYGLELSAEVRSQILERIGWPIPYYLQLVFNGLRDEWEDRRESPNPEVVDRVYQQLLSPARRNYFDYWRQRLSQELGNPDGGWAIDLLDAMARDPNGVTRETLLQILASAIPEAKERKAKVLYLLDVLRTDGYAVEEDGRFQFRSPLLRDFWRERTL